MRDIGRVIASAVDAARPHYREFIAAMLENRWEDAHEASRHFAMITARGLLLADVAGRADVWDALTRAGVEVFRREVSYTAGLSVATGSDRFFVGPYADAVMKFESRIPRLRSEIDRLSRASMRTAAAIVSRETAAALPILVKRSVAFRAAIETAFWVSDVDLETVVNLKSLVADVIRGRMPEVEGEKTLPDFIDRARLAGATNLTDNRLETIYRTNLMAANGNARADALSDRDVRRVAPLVRIVETKDRRTRGAPGGVYGRKGGPNPGYHWQMDGYINTVDEIRRLDLVPPNGYNCRGALRAVLPSEARRLGLFDDEGQIDHQALRRYNGDRQRIVDAGLYPDPGFRKIGITPAVAA